MGYRLEIKERSGRIVYSHSYPSMKSAKAAIGGTRGATGKVIRS
jgi:hypothetical protein